MGGAIKVLERMSAQVQQLEIAMDLKVGPSQRVSWLHGCNKRYANERSSVCSFLR